MKQSALILLLVAIALAAAVEIFSLMAILNGINRIERRLEPAPTETKPVIQFRTGSSELDFQEPEDPQIILL